MKCIVIAAALCCLANSASAGERKSQLFSYGVLSYVHEIVSRCGYNFSNDKDLFIIAAARTGMRGRLIKSFGVRETDLNNFDQVWKQWAALRSCKRERRGARMFINILRTQYEELYRVRVASSR